MMGLAAALGDRLNPVLVKEVRQALRGRQFKIGFWTTVCAATVVGIYVLFVNVLGGQLDTLGRAFYVSIYGCMAAALMVLVPVLAFFSMAAETDEHTYELLVLSNLRPRGIVAGKLSAAGVQALLFLSAFGPFLVFSFLLRGVDLVAVAVSIALCTAASVAFSSAAICLSTLTSMRFARVLLLLGSLALSGLAAFSLTMATWAMQAEVFLDLTDPGQQAVLATAFLALALVGGLAFTVACGRLAHVEENRSSGLRVVATAFIAVGTGWMAWMLRASRDAEVLSVIACALLFLVAVTATFTATEAEKLGRRTALRVPRNRALALLVSPFLPGGGRGVLLFGLHVALIAGGVWMSLALTGTPVAELWGKGGWSIVVLSLYLCVYVLLPSRLCSSFTGTVRGRIFARIFILLFVLAATFLPTLAGFFVNHRPLMKGQHAGHPFGMMEKVWTARIGIAEVDGSYALVTVALVVLVLNFPRVARGILEVRAASRARATEQRAIGSGPVAAEAGAGPVAGG